MKILVVDDDMDFADGMAEMLQVLGHEAKAVYSCDEGVAAGDAEGFDIAMIDVSLAGESGVDCATRLRASNPDLDCALMSGYSTDTLKQMGIEIGDLKFFRKPVKPEELSRYLDG